MDVYAPQTWLPHERPLLPGSPSTPHHSALRRCVYLIVCGIVAITGGLGNALVTVNLPYLQGSLGVYAAEIVWRPSAQAANAQTGMARVFLTNSGSA